MVASGSLWSGIGVQPCRSRIGAQPRATTLRFRLLREGFRGGRGNGRGSGRTGERGSGLVMGERTSGRSDRAFLHWRGVDRRYMAGSDGEILQGVDGRYIGGCC